MTVFNILKTTAPAISNLVVTASQNNNVITWDSNLTDQLLSTNIYRNTTNNRNTATKIGTSQINNTYTDATITPGTTYYYWAKTVDKEGVESGDWSTGTTAGISILARKILTGDITSGSVSARSYTSGGSAAFGSWDTYNTVLASSSFVVGSATATISLTYNFEVTLYSATSIAANSMYGVTMKLILRNTTSSTDVLTVEVPIIQLSDGTAKAVYGPDFNQRLFSGTRVYPAGAAANTYVATLYLKQTRTDAGTVGSVSAGNVNLALTGVYV